MKRLITLFAVISMLFLVSCTDYTYTYKIRVDYIHGGTQDITASMTSFNANKVKLIFSNSTGGLLGGGGTSPSLFLRCGAYRNHVASDVRSYKVLNVKKVEVE